ncbi:MAG TPA: GNAT family N-acetyltransferase [Chitinophagaceae bacterium]|nr:GNAT family N-acetyltransferase [Chitinophagaceae bacterium]
MNIKVIMASIKQADTIASIGKQSFRDAFGHLFSNRNELREYLDYTYDPEKIARSIEKENNVFFLAFVENVPVGFAKVKKYSLNEQIESIAQTELQKIYVLSYYHGSGAGAALMQSVIDLAQEIGPDFLWLDTHIANAKAIRFYEKYGFKKMGKYYFMIGSQTFEYHLMAMPVQEMIACNH